MTYKPHSISPDRTSPKVVKERIEISEAYLLGLLKKHLLNYSLDDRGNASFMKFFSATKDARHSAGLSAGHSAGPSQPRMEIDLGRL